MPLESVSSSNATPAGIRGQPSLEEVENRSRAGGSRLDAEQFAVAVAHLLCDVRGPVDGEQAISAIASASLDPTIRTWLVTDRNDQRAAGTLRHYDTSLDLWIRSATVGPASSPERVNVEVVGNVASDPLHHRLWYSTRYDVVREGGAWRLLSYHNGRTGPHTSANLTAREQRQFLNGPGWRRLPAAE